MSVLSVSASAIAHGVHYSVLAIGLLGMVALLGPQLLGGGTRRPQDRDVGDEHRQRVRELERRIATGSLGVVAVAPPAPAVTRAEPAAHRTSPPQVLVPVAVVSSAAAAGVHGAVGPAHFGEGTLIGLFFAGAALAQISWAVALVLRPHRSLLRLAVLGNTAVVLLWLVTRTLGLPAGLLPGPEAVGPWDLACVGWELTLVVACLHLLRRSDDAPPDLRLPDWADWPTTARAWAVGSGLVLVALSFSGASA